MAFSAIVHRLHRQAPLLASAAILVVFGFYLAPQIIGWLELIQATATADKRPIAAAGVDPDLQQMEGLFGIPPQMQDDSQLSSVASIDITLHGGFVHAQPERSIAILQRAGGIPEVYRPGDELDNGVSLQTVYADRVEILRNGSVEALYFPTPRSAPLSPDDLSILNAPPGEIIEEPQEPYGNPPLQQMRARANEQTPAQQPTEFLPNNSPTEDD